MARRERVKERTVRGLRPFKAEGERLKAFRKALFPHLSFSQYAEDVGLNAHAYRQNENGKTRISVENALILRAYYKLPLCWVYAGDDGAMMRRESERVMMWLTDYRAEAVTTLTHKRGRRQHSE